MLSSERTDPSRAERDFVARCSFAGGVMGGGLVEALARLPIWQLGVLVLFMFGWALVLAYRAEGRAGK